MMKLEGEKKQIILLAYDYLTEEIYNGINENYYKWFKYKEREKKGGGKYCFYAGVHEYPEIFVKKIKLKKSDASPEEKEQVIQQAFDILIEQLKTTGYNPVIYRNWIELRVWEDNNYGDEVPESDFGLSVRRGRTKAEVDYEKDMERIGRLCSGKR